jgi:hypothetical protein
VARPLGLALVAAFAIVGGLFDIALALELRRATTAA